MTSTPAMTAATMARWCAQCAKVKPSTSRKGWARRRNSNNKLIVASGAAPESNVGRGSRSKSIEHAKADRHGAPKKAARVNLDLRTLAYEVSRRPGAGLHAR